MAGIAFLYAIWHSPIVRSRLALVDVEYTVHAAISVLADLVEKCPPAEACKDAFDRMSKATIKMSLSTTGFKPSLNDQMARSTQQDYKGSPSPRSLRSDLSQDTLTRPSRPPPQFDMNLRDLFPELQDGRTLVEALAIGSLLLRALRPCSRHHNMSIPQQMRTRYPITVRIWRMPRLRRVASP